MKHTMFRKERRKAVRQKQQVSKAKRTKIEKAGPDLLKAFERYGVHKMDCNLMSLIPCVLKNGKKVGCTCGFEQAMEKAGT